ncbi:MAG TPA: heavy metal-associated domain-containing protein [Polyangiaceae bacterium]|jgi:copper chaperone|nr:MAG: Copper chaperone CopZ [Deltaproteobacteria bacterium ADurb.Bin207]HNZ25596.1 heavy metal-associated domain-containing protein [Polyangiaceae bacterium]
MKTEIQIGGMSCQHCVKAVEQALGTVQGVQQVEVSVGRAVVITERAPDMNAIRNAIEEEGFQVI